MSNSKVDGLILFGDSVFAGTGATDRQLGCGKLIKNRLEVPVVLKSRNRDTSLSALNRVTEDVVTVQQANTVIIMFGNNDCWLDHGKTKVEVSSFRANLRALFQIVIPYKKFVVACNLQPLDNVGFYRTFSEYVEYEHINASELQEQYSKAIEQECSAQCVRLIDIRSKLASDISGTISADGIHPNNAGHRIIANIVMREIRGIGFE